MSERVGGDGPSEGIRVGEINDEYAKELENKYKKLGRFKMTQQVNIQKSSGQMESDWIVCGYNEESDRIVVIKRAPVGAATVQEMVTKDELERWNPQ